MSGSSLDGLDIAYVHLEEVRGKWSFDIKHAECVPYSREWSEQLSQPAELTVPEFLKLNTAYGHYLGRQVNAFIGKYNLDHKIDFIASHGHTVFHEPENRTTFQVGCGASMAAEIQLPVINDLRAVDVALGGQGAPIVPVGDNLLFGEYNYLLNIGGIANITIRQNDGTIAFDICPANQILNELAKMLNMEYDEEGKIAATGSLLTGPLNELSALPYYSQAAPKSLSNESVREMVFPFLFESSHSVPDMLHTMVTHIAEQVANAVKNYKAGEDAAKMLVTGGGALNKYLVQRINEKLQDLNIELVVPDPTITKFKEALVMALIGTLRWREEVNVLSSVTGAKQDSINGAVWMA